MSSDNTHRILLRVVHHRETLKQLLTKAMFCPVQVHTVCLLTAKIESPASMARRAKSIRYGVHLDVDATMPPYTGLVISSDHLKSSVLGMGLAERGFSSMQAQYVVRLLPCVC